MLQVRHYLSVMNMQKAFIACLYGNNENEFVYRTIKRDLIEEEDIIDQETYFWQEHVLKNVVPPHNGNSDLVLANIRNYGGFADKSIPEIVLSGLESKNLEKYLTLSEEKSQLENGKRKSKQNSGQSVFLLWNSWGRAARQCWRTVRTVTVLPIIRPDVLRLGKTRWRS